MKRAFIIAAGIGTLALAGGSGAYLYLQQVYAVAPALEASAAPRDDLPLGRDWHSLAAFMKLQQAAATKDPEEAPDQVALRAARQAELRRRLQPPLLPLQLVADAAVKTSPKSHWGDGAEAAVASGDARKTPLSVKTESLVSDTAKETIATLEAFKTALRETGGDKHFPVETKVAASPYSDR